MSAPKIIFKFVFLLTTLIGYSQNNNQLLKLDTPPNFSSYKQSNLVIENMLIEFTMLDWKKDNNKKLRSFAQATALLQSKKKSFDLPQKDNITLLFEGRIETFDVFSNVENRLNGTASIHYMPEKFPQAVSAVPSNLSIVGNQKHRPKSFGALHKF